MDKAIGILTSITIGGFVSMALLAFLIYGFTTTTTDENGNTTTHTGIYEVLGTVPTDEAADDNVHVIPDAVIANGAGDPPSVAYDAGIVSMGVCYPIGEFINVTINGTTYDGMDGTNGGFSITITEIKNEYGHSVLTKAEYDITDELEDLNISCLYITEDNTLTFYTLGAYDVTMVVTASTGKSAIVVVRIPVGTI